MSVDPPTYFLGVDVGKTRDQTVIAVLEKRGSCANLVDVVRLPLGLPYSQQARELAALARQWRCPPTRMLVEVNGPGMALLDTLTDGYSPPVWNAEGVVMSHTRKAALIANCAATCAVALWRRGDPGAGEPRWRTVSLAFAGTPVRASAVGPDVRKAALLVESLRRTH